MIRTLLGRMRRAARRAIHGPDRPFAPDAAYFTDPRKVYLASADQWRGLEGLCEAPSIWPCREFHAVVGGLGCLNLLSRLDQVERVCLFDINPHQVAYGAMMLDVIAASSSRAEFISLLLQRDFAPDDAADDRLAAFMARPRREELRLRLLSVLGSERFARYERHLGPHLDHLGQAVRNSATDHCLELSLVHDAPADAPMTIPGLSVEQQFSQGRISRNSFFFGRGWLRDEHRFLRTRALLARNLSLKTADIADLAPGDEAGLYASNILEAGSPLIGRLLARFDWMAWYAPQTGYLHAAYACSDRSVIPPQQRITTTPERGHHLTCEDTLRRELGLDRHRFVEIVHPNPSEGLHTGFRFLLKQEKASATAILAPGFTPFPGTACIGLHTLLGSGLGWDEFQAVVDRACAGFRQVFVLEHHPNAPDWPEPDIHAHQLPSPAVLDRLLLRHRTNWRKIEYYTRSEDARPRNLLWISDAP